MGYIILITVVSVIILLLFAPVKAYIKYDQELFLTVKFLFVKTNPLEKKEKKDKDSKDEKEKPEDPPPEKKEKLELATIKAGYEGAKILLDGLGTRAKKLLKKIKMKNLNLFIIVSGDNPMTSGEKYGQITALVYSVYGLLINSLNVHEKTTIINIEPDFLESETEYKVSTMISIRPITILRHGIGAGMQLLKAFKVFKDGLE